MKKASYILIVLIGLLLTASCKKETTKPIHNDESLLIEGTALMVTEDQRMPVILKHEDGGKAAMIDNDLDGRYDRLVYQENNLEMVMDVDEFTGLPTKLFASDGGVLLYQYKENNTLLDIAIIDDKGEVGYVRDIDISTINGLTAKAMLGATSKGSNEKVKEMVSGLSLAWSMGVCAVSGALTVYSGGAGWFLSAAACSGFLAQFSIYVLEDIEADASIARAISDTSYLVDYFNCTTTANIPACVSATIGTMSTIEDLEEVMTQNVGEENITLANGALTSGYGAVKVTLIWNTNSDIDLWVTDPLGERIYFNNPSSASGGILDIDDQEGVRPENIFWSENPPLGQYLVQVHYYADNGAGATSYTVQIETTTYIQKVSGVLNTEGQLDNVSNFTISDSQKAFKSSPLGTTMFYESEQKK